MKKITTKVLVAMLAVLIAVVSLGTSTFAWFSMNKTVEASSLKVKAVTVENLFIQDEFIQDANYKQVSKLSLELKSTVHELYPIHIVEKTAETAWDIEVPETWQEGKEPTADTKGTTLTTSVAGTLVGSKVVGEDSSITPTMTIADSNPKVVVDFTNDTTYKVYYTVDENPTDTETEGYVTMLAHDEMTICKQSADSTNTAKYSAEVTISGILTEDGEDVDADIYKALVVSFLVSNDNGATWALVNCAVEDVLDETTGEAEFETDGSLKLEKTLMIEGVKDNSCIQIEMLVWYNGESEHCINNNALATDTLEVSVIFSYEDEE